MAGQDRISHLPDEILHHILSFLPITKLRAQTSLLSRRWRHLWTHHPSLVFYIPSTRETEIDAVSKAYVLAVDRCLQAFNPPSLHFFCIDLWLPTSCTPAEAEANIKSAERWLRFAGLRSVSELNVQARTHRHGWEGRIPCSLFCCLSLTDLTVRFSTFPNVPSNFQGFRYLKNLFLGYGSVAQDTLAELLEVCPVLESLSVVGCCGPTYVDISMQNLPNLTDLILLNHWIWLGASIEAPNLRSIQFEGNMCNLDWKGSPALTKATLRNKTGENFETLDDWMRIVSAVSNVNVLTVNYWFYQFEIPKNYSNEPMFKNLKELNCGIYWITGSVLRALTTNLGECPLLEKLCINLNYEPGLMLIKNSVQDAYYKDLPADSTSRSFRYTNALKHVEDDHELDIYMWDPSEHLGELNYALCHLKTIRVKEFLGTKNEMRLLEFLLGKAIALEKFIVFDFLERNEAELHEVFATIPRASSQVQMKLSLWENFKLDMLCNKIFD